MKTIAVFCVLFALFCLGQSYLLQFLPSKSTNPDYPNHCYEEELNAYYEVGAKTHQRKGKCEGIECHHDFSMTAYGCGVISNGDPDYEVTKVDYEKPYPECCPQLVKKTLSKL